MAQKPKVWTIGTHADQGAFSKIQNENSCTDFILSGISRNSLLTKMGM